MANIVVIVVILILVIIAIRSIFKAKKNGKACIGCPESSTCRGKSCCK